MTAVAHQDATRIMIIIAQPGAVMAPASLENHAVIALVIAELALHLYVVMDGNALMQALRVSRIVIVHGVVLLAVLSAAAMAHALRIQSAGEVITSLLTT